MMVEEQSTSNSSRLSSDFSTSVTISAPEPCSSHDQDFFAVSSPVAEDKKLTTSPAEETASATVAVAATAAPEIKPDGDSNLLKPSQSKSHPQRSRTEASRTKRGIHKTKSEPARCGDVDGDSLSSKNEEFDDGGATKSENGSSGKPEGFDSLCVSQPENDSSQSLSPSNPETSRRPYSDVSPFSGGYPKSEAAIRKLRLENEKLQAEVTRLRRLVVAGASSLFMERNSADNPQGGESSVLEVELQLVKEALSTLKADKRRLKAEKFDLLSQMKQLYATLEDKEKELRDFIRNYRQKVREKEASLQQLSTEREERERERWSLLRHARDEAERSLSLAAQLNAKELQLQQTQKQLQHARRQLSSSGCLSDQESLSSLPRHSMNEGLLTPGFSDLLSIHHDRGLLPGDRGSCSADSGVRVTSDRESGVASAAGNLSDSTVDGRSTITIEEGNGVEIDSVSVVSSVPSSHMYQRISTKDCSPMLSPLNAKTFSRSVDVGVLSRSVEQLSSPLDPEPVANMSRKLKHTHGKLGGGRGGTWGSISRVFARSRHRSKASSLQENCQCNYDSHRSWSPLNEEGYAEKLKLLREAASIPMEKWRAPTVLAWLEVALGMPQYGARCAENIKSGKVLLELSDLELECGLGIAHPMHRKKVRLAIEEHRNPSLIRYPCIAQLGHTWVSSEWLPDIGLPQYSETFMSNMVDARMLEQLSKKELEKYLGVTRKFHQASIVHGIHLLRILKYDRQALAVRRHQCEGINGDPLVWTNQRFIRWIRSIDLIEYADNLKDSGVHGGLVVLEPSFNGDTLATALGIPSSKNIIRRHLNTELDALILPARYVIFCQVDELQQEAARVIAKHSK